MAVNVPFYTPRLPGLGGGGGGVFQPGGGGTPYKPNVASDLISALSAYQQQKQQQQLLQQQQQQMGIMNALRQAQTQKYQADVTRPSTAARGTVIEVGNKKLLIDPTTGNIMTAWDIPAEPTEPAKGTKITVGGKTMLVDPFTGEEIKTWEAPQKPEKVPPSKVVGGELYERDPITSQWKSTGIREKEVIKEEDKRKVADTFRKEFDSLSDDYRKIRDSFARIIAANKDPSAAGDLAIIFNYMKILDPGSVVRESEFATAENAAGVPDKIRNMWNKALTGERITYNRQDFVDTAKRLYESQAGIQKNLVERYSTLAKRFNVDPQDVVTTPTEFFRVGQKMTGADGKTYKYVGDNLWEEQ